LTAPQLESNLRTIPARVTREKRISLEGEHAMAKKAAKKPAKKPAKKACKKGSCKKG
jgi:hypothetical protein